MSKIDNMKQGEPNFLDGSPPCPGQNLRGIIPPPYNKFFNNFEDYTTYRTHNHHRYVWETQNEFMARDDKWSSLADLLDPDYIRDYYEKERLQKQREARASARVVNRYELGAREFTFTYSPKWYTDSEARLLMTTAIQKLCKTYKDEIIQLRAVGEVGESSGLSHIHAMYKLRGGKKITDKNFKRAYKKWDTKIKVGATGHQGGHHQTVKSESDFSGYIDKDIENAWFQVDIDNSTFDPQ